MITLLAALALAGGVFALLHETNQSGLALMFGKEGFRPTQFMHFAVWSSLAAAVIGTLIFPIALGFVQQSFEAQPKATAPTPEISITPEEQKRERHKDQGLTFVADVPFDRPDQSAAEKASIVAALYAGEAVPGDDDFWIRPGRIDYQDGTATTFTVGVLFDSRAWKSGDSRRLEATRGSSGAQLETALRTSAVRELVQSHLWTICIGLASAEHGGGPDANEQLSDDRAYHLCKALVNLNYAQSEKVKGLGLGVARLNPTSAFASSRQRPAVIIGVTPLQRMHAHDIYVAATRLIKVNGVVIDGYTRARSGYTVFENISKGSYDGASGIAQDDSVTDVIGPNQ